MMLALALEMVFAYYFFVRHETWRTASQASETLPTEGHEGQYRPVNFCRGALA